MQKNIYLIGIGGIGVSAIARYYLAQGWQVFGSDTSSSKLIENLKSEGCDIIIGDFPQRISTDIHLVVYSEAVPEKQQELQRAKELNIKILKYNEALANIANDKKLIAISGTHGKSTTTSLVSLILKNSGEDFYSVVGTLLKEFEGKNFYSRVSRQKQAYFAIEACEHKEHFLLYSPMILIITNIDFDHADYFHTPERYVTAFEKMVERVRPGGFVVFSAADENSQKLVGKRTDIHYIGVTQNGYIYDGGIFTFPKIVMQVPGDHILLDAKLAYIVAHMIGISDDIILKTLQSYTGVWRRMEIIGTTQNRNILMSDYGHHPTEVSVTLKALREGYPDKKLFVVFQPHQYSRTLELLEGFKNCFSDATSLIIPNIYESRDTQENKQKINTEILVEMIHHSHVINGNGLENSLKLIEDYDAAYPNSSIILLQGAGDVDNLRYKIRVI